MGGFTGSPLLPDGTGAGPLLRPPLDADVAALCCGRYASGPGGWCLDGTAAGELLPLGLVPLGLVPLGLVPLGAGAAGGWCRWGLLLPLSHGGWGC